MELRRSVVVVVIEMRRYCESESCLFCGGPAGRSRRQISRLKLHTSRNIMMVVTQKRGGGGEKEPRACYYFYLESFSTNDEKGGEREER